MFRVVSTADVSCGSHGDVRVVSTADVSCGSHAFQHYSALSRTKVRALSKIHGFTWIAWQIFSNLAVIPLNHWSALNTLKSLRVPADKNPRDWSQEIVQASWLGLRVLSTAHRKSGSGAVWQWWDNEVVPHHAWVTCVVTDEQTHVPRVLAKHSPKNNGSLHLLVC
jgi:hypothetical protein